MLTVRRTADWSRGEDSGPDRGTDWQKWVVVPPRKHRPRVPDERSLKSEEIMFIYHEIKTHIFESAVIYPLRIWSWRRPGKVKWKWRSNFGEETFHHFFFLIKNLKTLNGTKSGPQHLPFNLRLWTKSWKRTKLSQKKLQRRRSRWKMVQSEQFRCSSPQRSVPLSIPS